MMRQGHYALASGPAVVLAAGMTGEPTAVRIGCAVLVIASSTYPDLDHDRFSRRLHPGAALVRWMARLVEASTRTQLDEPRTDAHRGFSHTVPGCLVFGGVFVALTAMVPPLAPWCWWWGLAVTVGTLSHLAGDVITPSGIPILFPLVRDGRRWKRYSLRLVYTDSAAEHLIVVPLLWAVTSVLSLGLLGLLGPALALLTGV